MRIGFDISILHHPEPTGVEKSFRQLLTTLAKQNRGHEFVLISPESFPVLPKLSGEFSTHLLPVPRNRLLWRERDLPSQLEKLGIEIFHSPVSAFPLTARCKTISTLHELPWQEARIKSDEGSGFRNRAWAHCNAQYASRVLCVSERTRSHFLHLYPSAKSKARVVHHGVSKAASAITEKPTNPYFLVMGRIRTKKNIAGVLRAFQRFLQNHRSSHELRIVGPGGNALELCRELASDLKITNRVQFTGYVPEEEIPRLLRQAEALISYSYSEGFGLTPIEAMSFGTPVISTRQGIILELSEQSYLAVHNDRPDELANAMQRLAQEHDLREKLSKSAERELPRFQWENSVETLLQVYEELHP